MRPSWMHPDRFGTEAELESYTDRRGKVHTRYKHIPETCTFKVEFESDSELPDILEHDSDPASNSDSDTCMPSSDDDVDADWRAASNSHISGPCGYSVRTEWRGSVIFAYTYDVCIICDNEANMRAALRLLENYAKSTECTQM